MWPLVRREPATTRYIQILDGVPVTHPEDRTMIHLGQQWGGGPSPKPHPCWGS